MTSVLSACPATPAPAPDDAALDAPASTTDAAIDAGPPSHCATTPTRLTGVVRAPNGLDPLAGALVYAVSDDHTFTPPSTTVACRTCASATDALAWVESGADGTFALGGPALDDGGTFTLVTEAGGFRRVARHVVVPACGEVALERATTTLPSASAGDDVAPRILVAHADAGTGNVNDDFAHILDVVGVAYDTVDPERDGNVVADGVSALLSDPARLAAYDILALPCGVLGNFSVGPHLTDEHVTHLRAWLGAGGRLYASDLAYELVARTLPDAIVFAPGPSPRLDADPADVGQGIATASTLDAVVEDARLLAWLQALGAVPDGSDLIPISDLRDPWAAVDTVPDGQTGAEVVVGAEVTWHTMATAYHPLTVQVDATDAGGRACGRVLFSSYHVQTSLGTTLAPQERVLEYLFFRLGECLGASAP